MRSFSCSPTLTARTWSNPLSRNGSPWLRSQITSAAVASRLESTPIAPGAFVLPQPNSKIFFPTDGNPPLPRKNCPGSTRGLILGRIRVQYTIGRRGEGHLQRGLVCSQVHAQPLRRPPTSYAGPYERLPGGFGADRQTARQWCSLHRPPPGPPCEEFSSAAQGVR